MTEREKEGEIQRVTETQRERQRKRETERKGDPCDTCEARGLCGCMFETRCWQ